VKKDTYEKLKKDKDAVVKNLESLQDQVQKKVKENDSLQEEIKQKTQRISFLESQYHEALKQGFFEISSKLENIENVETEQVISFLEEFKIKYPNSLLRPPVLSFLKELKQKDEQDKKAEKEKEIELEKINRQIQEEELAKAAFWKSFQPTTFNRMIVDRNKYREVGVRVAVTARITDINSDGKNLIIKMFDGQNFSEGDFWEVTSPNQDGQTKDLLFNAYNNRETRQWYLERMGAYSFEIKGYSDPLK